jgi:hypothetical protein
MSPAEEQFSLTFKRFLKSWTVINSFRQVAHAGLPLAEKMTALMYSQFVQRVTANPEYDRIFIKKQKFLDDGGAKWLLEGMTKQAIVNARASVDAASLIFAHSILDDSAWSYCEVTALAQPEDWEPYIENKKVEFKLVKERKYEDLLKEAVEKRLKQLRNESLLEKADMLHKVCKPPANFAPLNNYAYDRDRLEILDEARHRVVHGDSLGETLPNIESDLEYIGKTVNYFMGLVNERYGIQIDPLILINPREPFKNS